MYRFMLRSHDYIVDSPSKGTSKIAIGFIRMLYFIYMQHKSNLNVSFTSVRNRRDGRPSYFSGQFAISVSFTGIRDISIIGDTGKT